MPVNQAYEQRGPLGLHVSPVRSSCWLYYGDGDIGGSIGVDVEMLVGWLFFICVRLKIAGYQIRLRKTLSKRYVAGCLKYLSQTETVLVAT